MNEKKCKVISCNNEIEEGICENCRSLLENREYIPHICWNCQSIIDIYERIEKTPEGEVVFSKGCRNCGNEKEEKNKFLIKKE